MTNKICTFGFTGSGKTCFIYAMSQVMSNGVEYGNTKISAIANIPEQQHFLNAEYMKMVQHKWPDGSKETTPFDFKIRVRHNDRFQELIPSLIMQDYRGGVWGRETDIELEEKRKDEVKQLMTEFTDKTKKVNGREVITEKTVSIIFLIDGNTLLNSMDNLDKEEKHRNVSAAERLMARQQILFVENLFDFFKKHQERIPPILITITKADMFASKQELDNAYEYIKKSMPSLFSEGSGVDVAITTVSLGTELTNTNGRLDGILNISIDNNIHIPMIFALYAYLDELNGDEDDMAYINSLMKDLVKILDSRIQLYSNGKRAIAVYQ